MKAARFHEYGGIDVIRYEDTSIPEIGDDELLIQVAATALNPADRLIVSGAARHLVPISLPHTVGLDVSGIVVRTGKSVTHFHAGDGVYTFQYFDRDGGAAEYVACPAAHVSRAPASIPLCEIGALPAVALTAWQALFVHGDLQAGQRVLITAAAGGRDDSDSTRQMERRPCCWNCLRQK
jgi:NADPH:quinone reductase-like Zn-dependent oxidoreductase